jgi:Fic family protein
VLERPVLYLSEYFKKNREVYFTLLNDYHNDGEVDRFIKFFLEGICEVAKDAIDTSKKINQLKERDYIKIQSLGKSSKVGMKVLQELYKLPIVDVSKVTEWIGMTRVTANTLVNNLVKLGILTQQDETKEYGRVFEYKNYLDIFRD